MTNLHAENQQHSQPDEFAEKLHTEIWMPDSRMMPIAKANLRRCSTSCMTTGTPLHTRTIHSSVT